MIQIKRIYDQPAKTDGFRVLVDRLWPRGVSKEKAAIDEWLKNIAPSPELRKWFDHKPERFEEFSTRYTDELSNNPAVEKIKNFSDKNHTLTILYGAKDPEVNHAVVLKTFLENYDLKG